MPIPFREHPDDTTRDSRYRSFKDKLDDIYNLALEHEAASDKLMESWRKEMQDTFLPNHSKNKYFGNLKVYEMLDDVLEKIESHVNTVDPITTRIDGRLQIISALTAKSIASRINRMLLSEQTQHSFSKHARVSGRYAAMTGVEMGRRSNEGGYYLARY